MSAYSKRMQWGLLLGFSIGFAFSTLARAEQSKGEGAEAKQAAAEETQESERYKGVMGNWQRAFSGTFRRFSDAEAAEAQGPDVVGTFVTDLSDKTPGRSYLVKATGKDLLATLSRFDGKRVRLAGNLREIGPDGEAKYLVVSDVVIPAETPRKIEHRGFGGI